MAAKAKPAAPEGRRLPSGPKKAKKAKKADEPRPISENPAAALALVTRARRGR